MAAACRIEPALSEAAERAAEVIARYAPGSLSDAAGGVVRVMVAQGHPGTPARAKALLFAAGRLVGFAEQAGIELSPAVLLSEAVVERFILEGCRDVSPATRRTLRSNLRALARASGRYPQPEPVALSRERAKPPYSAAQIEGYLRLAAAQSTQARRMRAGALICLGAGAGIIAGELRHLRGSDVVVGAGGMLVQVAGRRRRVVPVLERYQPPLLTAAGFAGEGLIVGGQAPGRRNITDELCRALSSDPALPRLESGRLRSSWLVACAERIGLAGFLQAAGIRCSQRLGDLAARLPAATDTELLALLEGHA